MNASSCNFPTQDNGQAQHDPARLPPSVAGCCPAAAGHAICQTKSRGKEGAGAQVNVLLIPVGYYQIIYCHIINLHLLPTSLVLCLVPLLLRHPVLCCSSGQRSFYDRRRV